MTAPATTLDAALRYAEYGWRILPLRPGLKVPLPSNGLNGAATDPGLIRAWWRQWPDAGVGIATGAPGPDVVDIDLYKNPEAGRAALDKLIGAGLLSGAFAQIRTRAGGLHFYMAGTRQGNTVALDNQTRTVDFRGAGGYVVAPPTWVAADDKGPAGQYQVVEFRPETGATFDVAAARVLLSPPKPERKVIPPGASAAGRGWFRMDRMTGYVAALPEGIRNAQLFWACCRAIEGGAADLTPLVDAAVTAGLTEAEAHRTAQSAWRTAGGPA